MYEECQEEIRGEQGRAVGEPKGAKNPMRPSLRKEDSAILNLHLPCFTECLNWHLERFDV